MSLPKSPFSKSSHELWRWWRLGWNHWIGRNFASHWNYQATDWNWRRWDEIHLNASASNLIEKTTHSKKFSFERLHLTLFQWAPTLQTLILPFLLILLSLPSLTDTPPSLLLCSPLSSTPFRTIKLRPRRKETCRSCGDPEKVGKDQILTHLEKEDYRTFCGINTVEDDERLSNSIRHLDVKDMSKSRDSILLDVRPSIEFGIAKLPESISKSFCSLRRLSSIYIFLNFL